MGSALLSRSTFESTTWDSNFFTSFMDVLSSLGYKDNDRTNLIGSLDTLLNYPTLMCEGVEIPYNGVWIVPFKEHLRVILQF